MIENLLLDSLFSSLRVVLILFPLFLLFEGVSRRLDALISARVGPSLAVGWIDYLKTLTKTEKDKSGLRITEVQKESAAAKAGLKENDILTKVDGETVSEPEALVQIIRKHKPDQEVTITYLRNGKQQKQS